MGFQELPGFASFVVCLRLLVLRFLRLNVFSYEGGFLCLAAFSPLRAAQTHLGLQLVLLW